MADRKLDAAAFGRPGHMATVIGRAMRPSRKSGRVRSAISCSHMSFCVPYLEREAGEGDSSTASGNGRPGRA
ncbi:hypothetical protein [Streptomyces violascens]|uniref:hypothetical protein n=1 Tax=Streptomyces violascens TaxID=67381 RepID=UPI0036B62753